MIDDLREKKLPNNFINKKKQTQKAKKSKVKKKRETMENLNNWEFTNVPGCKYKGENIVLEFVRILFEILIRERHYLKDIFLKLKYELLDFIGISRYSEKGNFQKVILKFNLINVICKDCFMVRNLDLFMDFEQTAKSFNCICGVLYDPNMIEQKILFLLKESFSYFLNQDVYCLDCKSLKEDYLSRKCFCGGNYTKGNDNVLHEYLIEAANGFSNFKNLADLCDFDMLKSYLIDMTFN